MWSLNKKEYVLLHKGEPLQFIHGKDIIIIHTALRCVRYTFETHQNKKYTSSFSYRFCNVTFVDFRRLNNKIFEMVPSLGLGTQI